MKIYQPLNQALQEAHALMGVAEVHGLFCGLSCTARNITAEQWLCYLFHENHERHENELRPDCQKQLFCLKEYTVTQLNSEDYQFDLLVPQDDSSLIERVQALTEWCQGFLLGFGLTQMNQQKLTEELKEFIKDVIAISHIAPLEQASEADEVAYMELIEYVRVGILTLYQELTTIE
jgi:hypothetical protein